MRALGLCEEGGGGIDKAILAMKNLSLPAPEFFAFEHSMRVVLPGSRTFSDLSKAVLTEYSVRAGMTGEIR